MNVDRLQGSIIYCFFFSFQFLFFNVSQFFAFLLTWMFKTQVKWMLKTSPDAWKEWPRIRNIHNVAAALKEHWQNRGVEERPNCEVSAWHSFLSSYASVGSTEASSTNGEFMALTSQETESVSVEVNSIMCEPF